MRQRPDGRRPESRHPINQRMMDVAREQNVTQADCIRGTGVTSPTVSDWFNKGAVPDAETLGLFCRMTRTNCHWMITGTGQKQAPGSGSSTQDQHIAMGAQAVLQDVRGLVKDLEHRWTDGSATRRGEQAAAFVRDHAERVRRAPGQKARRKAG